MSRMPARIGREGTARPQSEIVEVARERALALAELVIDSRQLIMHSRLDAIAFCRQNGKIQG